LAGEGRREDEQKTEEQESKRQSAGMAADVLRRLLFWYEQELHSSAGHSGGLLDF